MEYPIHVVCAWIGNTEMIAAKHCLQVTDDYFERAGKSGAVAVQQPAALDWTASPEKTKARPEPGFLSVGVASCEVVQDAGIPPRGLEANDAKGELDNTLRQSHGQGAAKSGALQPGAVIADAELRLLVETWPRLPEGVRVGIVSMVRSVVDRI